MVDKLEGRVAQIVVYGLGHAGRDQVKPLLPRDHADLVRRIHRVVAADAEEIPHAVGLHDLHYPGEVPGLAFPDLVAAGPYRAGGGRRGEQPYFRPVLRGQVDQLLLQNAFYPVPGAKDPPEIRGPLKAGFQNASKRIVDDGRRPARLGDYHVFRHSRHPCPFAFRKRTGCSAMNGQFQRVFRRK